jgi:hypothetical protein
MISYRHQEHSWQTSDGAIHLMINRGNQSTGDALALYSSFDGGVSYKLMFTLAATDLNSTSDGNLSGNYLLLTYMSSTNLGSIMFAVAWYDTASQSWTLNRNETVYTQTGITALNPTIGVDSYGNYWCGFVTQVTATGYYNIQMAYRDATAAGWTMTSLYFGASDNTSLQRSARLVPFTNGVGMIYTVHQTYYWAYRLSGTPLNQAWTTSTLWVGPAPTQPNPYESHFSVTSDTSNNLYWTFADSGILYFARYIANQQSWGTVRQMTQNISATYPQVSISGSTLLLIVNNSASGMVMISTDAGKTFNVSYILSHTTPPAGSTISFANPRFEAPSRPLGPFIPTWEQYVDNASSGTIEYLLYFQTPRQ